MSDNNQENRADASRRRFLRGVAMTGGAAVFAAGAGTGFAAGDEGVEAPASGGEKAGYRETQHIREYYKRADF